MGHYIRPAVVRQRMRELNMQVKDLAELADLGERTIEFARVARHAFRSVSEGTLMSLAEALKLPPADLCFGQCLYTPQEELARIDDLVVADRVSEAGQRLQQLIASAVIHHRSDQAQCLMWRLSQLQAGNPGCEIVEPLIRLVKKPEGKTVEYVTRAEAHQRSEFHRSCITVISPTPGQVLLYKRPPGSSYEGFWDCVGGHQQSCDAEFCLLQTAIRKAHEETPLFFADFPAPYPVEAFRQVGKDNSLISVEKTNREFSSVFVLRPPCSSGYRIGLRHVCWGKSAITIESDGLQACEWRGLHDGSLPANRCADGLSRVVQRCKSDPGFRDELESAICDPWRGALD